MANGFLVDTNVISELTRKIPNAGAVRWVEQHEGDTYISSITVEELEYGVEMLHDGKKKEKVRADVEKLLTWYGSRVIAFSDPEAKVCGEMLADARKTGNNCGIENVMIAATAAEHNMTVVTRNVKDFEPLGVSLVNPFSK